MATSGTYGFTLDADELLTEAWERCGKDAAALTDTHARSGLRSLQLALLSWTAAGLNLWQVDRQTVSLAAGQLTATTADATSDVLEAFVTVSGQDRALTAIGRSQWMALADKDQSGIPTTFWSERVNLVPVLHLWPVPSTSLALTYSRVRLPQDLSTLGQTPDAPVLWLDALSAELARRLAVKWAPDRVDRLTAEAGVTFGLASGENRERVPLRLTPRFD